MHIHTSIKKILGMTTANMKLVILDVPLDSEMESPDQNLEDGESIVRRVVEVKNLCRVLKGMSCCTSFGGAATRKSRSHLSHPGRKNTMKRYENYIK